MVFQFFWISRRFAFLSILVFSIFVFAQPALAAVTFYEVTNAIPTGNIYGGNSGTVSDKISQKYTAPANQTLCTLYLRVSLAGTVSASASIVLRVMAGGSDPGNGTQVSSSSVPASSLSLANPSLSYTAFALPSCISLSSGTTYWFTFENYDPVYTLSFGNYLSAYRNSNQFSYSSFWYRSCSACIPNYRWIEDTNREWGIKLEAPDPIPTMTNLRQLKSDGATSISEGGLVTPDAVIFSAQLASPTGRRVKLEVEARTTLTNQPNATSSLVNSSTTATVALANLADGDYFWQARAVDEDGYQSAWIPFGASSTVDFRVHREPVIIVPGILGTKLNRTSDGEEVWPNTAKMFFEKGFNGDIYLNDLILDGFGNQTLISSMNPTLLLDSAFSNDVYGNFINSFVTSGYASGTDFFAFPYDWRLDIASSTQRLDTIVKSAIINSPTGKVNIIAHSLGGLLVKQYLRTATSTSFVDKLVLAGIPELGSPKAFKGLTYGDNFSFEIVYGLFDILNQQRIKIISQNMPAVYQLLPSRSYISRVGGYIADYTSSTAGLLDYDQSRGFMLRDTNDSRNPTLLTRADSFHQTLDSAGFNVPISSIYRVSGCQNPKTIGDIRVQANNNFDIDSIDGDGTVPLKSATYSISGHDYFALYSQTGIDHMGLVGDSRTVNLIRDIVATSTTPSLATGISTNQSDCGLILPNAPNETTISFSTHSPVTLHIYDAQNRHLGPGANGDIEMGIPGGDYELIGDNSFAFVPGGTAYKVVARATASGSFDLKAKVYGGIAVKSVTSYLAVPLSSISTTAQMQFTSANTAGTLELDRQGDGVVDANIAPSAVISGTAAVDATPPTIDVQSPDELEFGRNEIVPISMNLSDSGSGIAFSKITLDGMVISTSTTSTIDLFYQPLGTHTLDFLAYDKAGNPTEVNQDFTSYADATSSIADIHRAFSLGWIKKASIRNDLVNDLKAVIKLEKKIIKLQAKLPPAVAKKLTPQQRIQRQIEKLEARVDKIIGRNFINELEKKRKQNLVTLEAYNLLKEDVEWMMNN